MTMDPRSEHNLAGVHPDLARVARRAAQTTAFIITSGWRSLAEQRALVAAGKSRKLQSRHLTGHALDVAAPGGRYDWPLLAEIALAFKAASLAEAVPVEWGAVWDRHLGTLGADMLDEIAAYRHRFRQRYPRRLPFVDGPHFQLPESVYPA